MIFLPFVLPICIWVAYSDLSRMKIPNYAVLALAAVFLIIAPFVMSLDVYFWRVLSGVIALAVGFLATQLRLIGAGDAKFAAAMMPFFAPAGYPTVMILLAVALLLAFGLHRLARAIPAVRNATPTWESWTSKKFPMGLALSATLASYLLLGVYFAAQAQG